MSMLFRFNNAWRGAVCIAIGLVVVAGSANVRPAAAQTSGWSEPKQLSVANQRSWFPDVMADATGRVHVLYSSGIRTRSVWDTVMYTSSADGVVWSSPVDIYATDPFGTALAQRAPAATRPTMLMDYNGNVHLSFRDDQTLYYASVPIQQFGLPSSIKPESVSKTDVPYFAEMAIDSKATIHFIYTQNVTSDACPICYQIFYRKSTDSGKSWSLETSISNPEIGAAKPKIVVDKNDNVHVVWEAGVGGSLGQVSDPAKAMYAVSYDGGNTWQPPLALPTDQVGEQGRFVTIGVDGQDRLVTVWMSFPRGLIYYQISGDQGKQWSAPQQILSIAAPPQTLLSKLSTFSMAQDSAGNLHLVLIGRTDTNQDVNSVLHLTWNGTSWSQPEAIVTDDKNMLEWPRIAVGLGNQLHVVWFLRDQAHIFDSDNGLYAIGYSRGIAPAPAVAPIVYPTPTPLPEPTATPVPIDTRPTSLPISPDFTPVSMTSIVGEGQSMAIIALAVIPVLLIALAVFFLRRRQ